MGDHLAEKVFLKPNKPYLTSNQPSVQLLDTLALLRSPSVCSFIPITLLPPTGLGAHR